MMTMIIIITKYNVIDAYFCQCSWGVTPFNNPASFPA